MRGTILDILVRIHQVIHSPLAQVGVQPDVISELLASGFTHDHIRRALQWRDRFFDEMPAYRKTQKSYAIRIFTVEESQKIPATAREFLQKLESMDVIDPALREFIIDQAMRLDMGQVDTPYFIWVVYMALDNQQGRNGDYSWLESVIFNETNRDALVPVTH